MTANSSCFVPNKMSLVMQYSDRLKTSLIGAWQDGCAIQLWKKRLRSTTTLTAVLSMCHLAEVVVLPGHSAVCLQ